MDDRDRIAKQLSDKRVYATDGVPVGKAMLLAECGRVMDVVDVTAIPADRLQLADVVCVNRADPLNPRAGQGAQPE